MDKHPSESIDIIGFILKQVGCRVRQELSLKIQEGGKEQEVNKPSCWLVYWLSHNADVSLTEVM